jgi:two-component system phosphate regulon sensor histidine kinase PhoR
MINLTPRTVALLVSMLPVLISVVFYILSYPYTSIEWYLFIILLIVLFVVNYFLSFYLVEKFIHKKIKVIYKTIHSLKLSKDSVPEDFKMDTDILNQVNKDVVDWASNKKEEIEQLKSMEQYRKEFIGNVAHELKTPIFNIQGYILTLLEGGLDDPRINRDYLQRAERSVERMITIVEELDTITKLESGQMKLDVEKFDIVALTKEVFEQSEIHAKSKNIKLVFHKNYDKPIYVKADKERIRQVLTNLIVNSIKYGKENGTSELRFYDMDDNLLIEVADDGVGINEKHLPRLFERFYRVDQSRSRDMGGSGLGLAIVKHIIEAHKQTINVRSTENVGSTFSFTLKKA